jgi:putative FmdB family regulatory protein
MPIYAYRCEHCGFQKDFLQKMSDPLLVTCPSCGEPALRKQVTAAGFQLKGSGWYVTDFRNPAAKEGAKDAKGDGAASDVDKKSDAPPAETKSASGDAPAPSPAPAAGEAPAAAKPTKASTTPPAGSS